MTAPDTGGEQEEYRGPERRRSQLRESSVNPDAPTLAAQVRGWTDLATEVGISITDSDDRHRLAEALRDVLDERERKERARQRRSRFGWLAIGALVAAAATNISGMGRWLIHLIPQAWWPPGTSGP